MADYEIPVTIKAVDKITKEVKKIVGTVAKIGRGISKFAGAGAAALGKLGAAAIAANQTLELLKKGVDIFRGLTEKSALYRGENDALIRNFKKSSDAVDSLNGRIGDILVTAFTKLVKAIRPSIDALNDFLVKNREKFANRLIEALFNIARAAIRVGQTFSVVFSRIKTFGLVAINTMQVEFAKGLISIGEDVVSFFDRLDKLFSKIPGIESPFTDTISSINEAIGFLDENVKDFDKEYLRILKENAETEQYWKDLYRDVDEFGKKTLKNAKSQALEAGEAFQTSDEERAREEARREEERKKREEERKKREAKLEAARKLAREAARKEIEKQQAEELERFNNLATIADNLGDSFGVAFQAMITGSKDAGKQFNEFLKSSLSETAQYTKNSIINAQLRAMADSGASAAFGGPLAIIAAASLTAAVFEAFIAKIPGMAQGGMVRGGTAGQDSVPAMLMPGEYVMNTNQVDAMRQMFSNMDGVNNSGRFANGGTVGGAPSLGGVNITIKSEALPNKAEVAKYVRSTIVPAMRDLQSQGAI